MVSPTATSNVPLPKMWESSGNGALGPRGERLWFIVHGFDAEFRASEFPCRLFLHLLLDSRVRVKFLHSSPGSSSRNGFRYGR